MSSRLSLLGGKTKQRKVRIWMATVLNERVRYSLGAGEFSAVLLPFVVVVEGQKENEVDLKEVSSIFPSTVSPSFLLLFTHKMESSRLTQFGQLLGLSPGMDGPGAKLPSMKKTNAVSILLVRPPSLLPSFFACLRSQEL